MRASSKEQSDPVGKSLVKRCQESEPELNSVIFFISALPELSEIPLVEKRQRHENCQSIMFDEERLDPHRVGNLPHVLTIKFGFRERGVSKTQTPDLKNADPRVSRKLRPRKNSDPRVS